MKILKFILFFFSIEKLNKKTKQNLVTVERVGVVEGNTGNSLKLKRRSRRKRSDWHWEVRIENKEGEEFGVLN